MNYSIVKINNSWNKSFSLFYATLADTTLIKDINPPKLNQILLKLAMKWDTDCIETPYIEAIAKYFPTHIMKKTSKDLGSSQQHTSFNFKN